MRKLLLFVLLSIVLCFASCGKDSSETENSKVTTEAITKESATEEPTTEEPTTEEPTTEEPTTEEPTTKEPTTEEPTTEYVAPEVNIVPNTLNFALQVNIQTNCVTVFAKDENGEYTVPYKSMVCSAGLPTEEYPVPTPLGTFNVSSWYTWCQMVDWTYGQYAYFIYSDIMFHSTPIALELNISAGNKPNPVSYSKGRIKVSEFNKLGEKASLGCIRLTVADAKWICENCPAGTVTTIIDADASADPLGKPEMIKINEKAIPPECGGFVSANFPDINDPYNGIVTTKELYVAWDPTDPDPANPWNNYGPEIKVPENKIIKVPAGVTAKNFFKHCEVSAIDTCRNDVSDTIKVSDNSIFKKKGTYKNITLSVKDLLGRETTETVTFIVN